MKKIAVISDISGLGRCSLSAALPVISALGCECCPVPTAVFTNQTGYDSYSFTDLTDLIPKFAVEWKKLDFCPDAILTGYMTSEKQVEAVDELIKQFPDCPLTVVDPSMAENGEIYKGFTAKMCENIKSLCAKADIITPNVSEFCLLSGTDYKDFCNLSTEEKLKFVRENGERLLHGRLKAITVTGIKGENKLITTLQTRKEFTTVQSKLFPGDFSGTGDIFSSALTAFAAKGVPLKDSLPRITDFLSKSIHDTTVHEHNCFDGTDFQGNLHLLTTQEDYNESK